MTVWPPVCHICGGEPTRTIEMSIPVRPYKEDRYFCDQHGDMIQAIMPER